MIRPNKKIGIVYSFNSIKYANELKQIIINYRTEGYCIEPIMVDNFLLDQERNIELRVFDNLSKCDYAFVFLTKDLYINSKDMFVSKPNSLEWQLKEIFSIWMSEKSMLSDAEQIVYIFERIVFLPFFPEKIIGSQLIDFLSVDVTEENSYIMACCKIIKNVNLYEEHKRKRNQIESTIFYTNIAKAILEEMQKFKLSKIAPIIGCVSKNYIGLSYLNSSLKSCNKENLKVAEKNFKEVIELSSNNLGDNMDVIQAFAKYNLARVKKNLNENAEAEYSIAIHKRDELSKASKFPQMFRLNFALERIHAEIDFCDYMLKTQEIDTTCYLRKIETMQKELSDIRQTPAADVSLFATIEDKLKQCAEEI